MDELVQAHLTQLNLPNISLIPLVEVETEELLAVKPNRSRGEYCWTLTPFTPQFVFDRDKSVQRVTYLDADLYFFDTPKLLLNEFEASCKHVLITDHAYSPEYDQSVTSGRFCVQFMTFLRTPSAKRVMAWWQGRCLEWCYARIEDGKFGDQKYLDDWPERFSTEVHVLKQVEKTLAPWNLRRFAKDNQNLKFVFYHFHSLRIVKSTKVVLYAGYSLGGISDDIYNRYLSVLKQSIATLASSNITVPTLPAKTNLMNILRFMKRSLLRNSRVAKL
jgi:hypothetical protein